MTQKDKGEALKALHEGEPFVIPNPWDAGSARLLAGIGFKALATTSGGMAFTLGRRDGNVSPEEVSAHVRAVDGATDLPVSVDLENGYGPRPEDAAAAIDLAAGAGAVGGSIEDFDRDEDRLYELSEATERVTAAAEAAHAHDFPFAFTARAENHLRGNPDLDDTIARLRAYEEAGADVLYAPGLTKAEEIRAVCEAVSKPVNVLVFAPLGMSMSEVAALGAQRLSVGSGLTWTAANAGLAAAEKLLAGDFSGLGMPDKRIRDWLAG